ARDFASDHRQIVFFDLPRLERLLEPGARLGRARQQQAAARVLVKPVHRRRSPLEPGAKLVQPGDDRIAPAAGRVDRQPGGLVDHHRLSVDVEDAVGENHRFPVAAVDGFVTPLQRAKESSALGNINLFPASPKWLMRASRLLRAIYALWRR